LVKDTIVRPAAASPLEPRSNTEVRPDRGGAKKNLKV
jgi:hypothetical protein